MSAGASVRPSALRLPCSSVTRRANTHTRAGGLKRKMVEARSWPSRNDSRRNSAIMSGSSASAFRTKCEARLNGGLVTMARALVPSISGRSRSSRKSRPASYRPSARSCRSVPMTGWAVLRRRELTIAPSPQAGSQIGPGRFSRSVSAATVQAGVIHQSASLRGASLRSTAMRLPFGRSARGPGASDMKAARVLM